MNEPGAPVPECYVGLWRRRLLRDAHGEDRNSLVYWLQTGSLYVDIRVHPGPRDTPAGRDAQQGFAGRLEVEGARLTWRRWLDRRPPGGIVDVGRVHFEGDDVLVEEGVLAPYLEIWERFGASSGDRAAFSLHAAGGGSLGVFVVLGGWFMYALEGRLAGARRERCEIGLGVRDTATGAWPIRLSTQPDLEGQDAFAVHAALSQLRGGSGEPDDRTSGLRWRCHERGALFRDWD